MIFSIVFLFSCAVLGKVSPKNVLQPELAFLEADGVTCPSGTSLQFGNQPVLNLPAYAKSAFTPSTAYATCNGGVANSACVWCAPTNLVYGVFDQTLMPQTGNDGFFLEPKCATGYQKTYVSASGSNGTIGFTWFGDTVNTHTTAVPPANLSSAVYKGWARYELCDAKGQYGRFIVPIAKLPTSPPSGYVAPAIPRCVPNAIISADCNGIVHCSADGLSEWGVNFACPHYSTPLPPTCTMQTAPQLANIATGANCCNAPACCNNLASSQNPPQVPYPSTFTDPRSLPPLVTCGTPGLSTCAICAPTPVVTPNTSTLFQIHLATCGFHQAKSTAAWQGSYALTGFFSSTGVYTFNVTNLNYNPVTDYGYVRVDYCDSNNQLAYWITYF